jgi:tRNA threonylcarbamoyladenosine biosynthesis protein TsaB
VTSPHPRRLDLGLDTASDDVSLALLDGDAVLAEHRWAVTTTIAAELLGRLDALLREAGASREELASIAVDVGPGGYGGLRAGVAVAQGLALARAVPLAGVGRLEVDAWPHLRDLPPGAPVVAVHDAGRNGLAWAAYALDAPDAAPREIHEPRIEPAADAVAHAPDGAAWCGELTPALREALDRAVPAEVRPSAPRSAADVVRLARLHGAYGDPELVDVLYLRAPPITQPRTPYAGT